MKDCLIQISRKPGTEEQLFRWTQLCSVTLSVFGYRGDKAVVMDLRDELFSVMPFKLSGISLHILFRQAGRISDEQISVENIRWYGESLWTLDANKSELTRFGCGYPVIPVSSKRGAWIKIFSVLWTL